VPLHDSLHDREANAGAGEVLVSVEALEDSEEFVRVSHVEPDSIVRDVKHDAVRLARRPNANARIRFLARVLYGVGYEVGPNLTQQGAITDDVGKLTNVEDRCLPLR
jgi:hypothetical protein